MTPKPINFAARFTMLARLLSGPATAAELAAAADLEQGHTSNILAAWERRSAVRATFETSGSGVRRMALRWQINVPQTGVCGIADLNAANPRPEKQSQNL